MSSAVQTATHTPRSAVRLARHMIASLLCNDRLTLSNVITTSGHQHVDWTADYRLYSKARLDSQQLFKPVVAAALEHLPEQGTIVIAVDDTLRKKSGSQISGVSWRRDPLGPPFQTNLVRGQRYQQFSIAWPLALPASSEEMPPLLLFQAEPAQSGPTTSIPPLAADSMLASCPVALPAPHNPHARPAKMVPIAFRHTPGVPKLAKKLQNDTSAVAVHKAERKRLSLTAQTLNHLESIVASLPEGRNVLLVGDGSYTNATILKGLPSQVKYLGRTRKDMVLNYPPAPLAPGSANKGRRLSYGAAAPTPEQLRQDQNTPWVKISGFASGRLHEFKVKVMEQVQWRKAGAGRRFRIIVIAPLGYRLKNGSKILYRQPAFLLSEASTRSVAEDLQSYLWRWGIEVNHRDEKTLIGVGDAQVRGENSNEHLPASTVAAYSMLLVVGLQSQAEDGPLTPLARPKWRRNTPPEGVASTGELQRQLRFDYWAGALRPGHYYRFVTKAPAATNEEKCPADLPAAVFCAA